MLGNLLGYRLADAPKDTGPSVDDRAPLHIIVVSRRDHHDTCKTVTKFLGETDVVVAPTTGIGGAVIGNHRHFCYRLPRYAPGMPGQYHSFPDEAWSDHSICWTETIRCTAYVIFRADAKPRLSTVQRAIGSPIRICERSEHFVVYGFISRIIPRASRFNGIPGYVATIPSHWDFFDHLAQKSAPVCDA